MIGRILFSGDRNWDAINLMRDIIGTCIEKYGNEIAIIHGAASGIDKAAGIVATDRDLTVWSEPAKWDTHGIRAGIIRNQLMIDRYKPHLVIACHPDIAKSKGTAHMMRIARKAGIPVIHISSTEGAENIRDELPERLS
jgi:hypothetical protein